MPLGMSKLSISDFLTDVFNTYKKKEVAFALSRENNSPSQNKKSPSRIYFLRRRFFFQRPKTHVTHCTSVATR